MKKDAGWAAKLDEIVRTTPDLLERERHVVTFVIESTDGTVVMGPNRTLIQCKRMKWHYIFDILKNAPHYGMALKMKLPPKFNRKADNEYAICAWYMPERDAVKIKTYTGNRREDRAGFDGFGLQPDELEAIEGLRDREGNWIEELSIKWT